MAAAVDSEKSFAELAAPPAAKRRRADWGLTPTEVDDLKFFFDGAEGRFGVRSSQGALEDELARRCPSDAARDQIATEHRARAVRRRRPKRTEFAAAFARAYKAFGLDAPLYREESDDVPLWAIDAPGGSDAHAYVGSSGGDVDLDDAERASHARSRLILVGTNWTGVLFAAFGPRAAQWAKDGRGNPCHPATWFGSHLVEIAVSVLAHRNYLAGERLDARAQVWSFASGGDQAVKLRDECREWLNYACEAYRMTRCGHPCRRCWPA